MLGFGRKRAEKKRLQTVIRSEPKEFVAFVKTFFDFIRPEERAHVMVAYENLQITFQVVKGEMARRGLVWDIEDQILQFHDGAHEPNDEINKRRFAWFYWASLLIRAGERIAEDETIREPVAEIWCDIARAAPLLRSLLPDNAVWTSNEKSFYDFVICQDDQDLIVHAINYTAPISVRHTVAVERLAKEFGLWYSHNTDFARPLTYIPRQK